MSYERLLYVCLNNGMSEEGFENMDIGMLFDFLATVNNIHFENDPKATKIRKASQKDFDSF